MARENPLAALADKIAETLDYPLSRSQLTALLDPQPTAEDLDKVLTRKPHANRFVLAQKILEFADRVFLPVVGTARQFLGDLDDMALDAAPVLHLIDDRGA